MGGTVEVSVVMSVHNGERFLREAVESIIGQSFRNFEFIIIDDGSTDDSGSILDRYEKNDQRVKVIHQKNEGLISSLNRGCILARGKYIARIDADDVAVPDRLLWQVDFMEKHPEVGVLGGAVELIDAVGTPLGICRNLLDDREIRSALPECPFWHTTVVMRRDVFIAVGGYRKLFVDAEDHDLWLRLAERVRLANMNSVLVRYRVHPNQVSVRRCKQQTLSFLAAQAAALARSKGMPEPFESVGEVTPVLLARLGVSESKQQTALGSIYLWRIRHMLMGNDSSAVVLHLLDELLHSPDLKYAERWVVADLFLLSATVHWRQGKLLRSIVNAGQAVITRPAVLGRPFKGVVRELGLYPTAVTCRNSAEI
jgi:hypothetical protein